jgi:hypothetical protein
MVVNGFMYAFSCLHLHCICSCDFLRSWDYAISFCLWILLHFGS